MRNPYAPTRYQSRTDVTHVDRSTGEVTKKASFSWTYKGPRSFKHNSDCSFINIPCGHCSECISIKQQSYVQRIYMESKYNHLFFATLTYDNKHLPTTEVFIPKDCRVSAPQNEKVLSLFNADGSRNEDAVAELLKQTEQRRLAFERDASRPFDKLPETDVWSEDIPEGHTEIIPYADIHHLQLMFKRMRDNNTLGRPFRYIAVSERGKKRARPHFHIIFLVPKHEGDDYNTCESLNAALKNMLLQFWAQNVGTRKNPVYERNFTYKQRFYNGELQRNFDCHYVQPELTTAGVSNVVFYVTKYIFKESKKEEQLRKMLFKHLVTRDDETGEIDFTLFNRTWDLVKSRMVCSKGIGLDGVSVTVDRYVSEPKTLEEYALDYKRQLDDLQDLPSNDFVLACPSRDKIVVKKRRILVPNFDLMQEIKDNSMKEKDRGRFVFVNYEGKHFSLSKYYQDRCLDEYAFVDLYYSTKPEFYPDPYRADKLTEEHREKALYRYRKAVKTVESHEDICEQFNEIERLGYDVDPYSPYRSNMKMVLGIGTKIVKTW